VGEAEWEREILDAVQVLFSNWRNTGVSSTLFQHKSKTQHCMGYYEENELHPSQS